MSAQRNRQLARLYKDAQTLQDLMAVNLIEDCVDHWEVTFKYAENNVVILRFKFHLVESIAPKVTVVFPPDIRYVCFEELGSVKWQKEGDIITLLLCLHQEYTSRGRVHAENSQHLTEEEQQKEWEYVKNAHSDWEIEDISYQLSAMALEELRKEATAELLAQ